MRDSQELFDLIHALSGPEKRYFKILSATYSGDKYYVRVFDILSRQKQYDEKALRENIRDKNIIRLLPRVKSYLKEQLLRCIRDCAESSSGSASLPLRIQQARSLFAHGLYDQCNKEIAAIKKDAKKYESLVHQLEAIMLEATLNSATGTVNRQDTIHSEYRAILKEMDIHRRYRQISDVVYPMLIHEGTARNPAIVKKLQSLIRHPLLRDEKKATHYQARYNFYQIYSFYHKILNQHEKGFDYMVKMKTLMEEKPHRINEYQMGYLSVLINMMDRLITMRRYEEVLLLLKKLRSVKPAGMPARIRIEVFGILYEQNLYMSMGEFTKAISLVEPIVQTIKRYKGKMLVSLEQVFYHNISGVYFGAGNYSQALKWINTALVFRPGYSEHLQSLGKIYQLIVHYEMRNQVIFPYLLRSTYRYLYKRKRLYKYESIILEFIKKSAKMNDRKKLLLGFSQLKAKLESLQKDNFEKGALEYFDIISWLESKIENKPFAEVVRLKAQL